MSLNRTMITTLDGLARRPRVDAALALSARALLSFIFIAAGYGKLAGYHDTMAWMESMSVPGGLLPLVILVELGGGLALLLGWQTRLAAAALAVFCVLSGVLFHAGQADDLQQILFMKNLAMAGGLLAIVRTGAGCPSVDKTLTP